MEALGVNPAAFLQWVLKATLQGSLLVCLIMLIKGILRDRLPARWHYCLWLILVIRLALPWAPQSRVSIYSLIPGLLSSHRVTSSVPVARSGKADGGHDGSIRKSSTDRTPPVGQMQTSQQGQHGAVKPTVMRPSGKTSVTSNGESWQATGEDHRLMLLIARILAWVWLAGSVVLAGYILVRALGLWRAVASERPVTDQEILDLLEDCKMQMRVRTLVGVVVTDKVQTPALYGFLRPRILLPQGLIETLGLDDLHYVFLHELAHLKRRDIYLAWLVCLLQVLHWFNPLIWFAFRRMRADQEVAADALALATAGTEESRRYGQTILSLLERFSRPQYLPSLAGILENPSHIERRIHMIAKFKQTPRRPLLAAVLLAVLGLIGLTDAQNKPVRQPEGKTDSTAVKEAVTAPEASSAGATEKSPLAGESSVFVDPQTGIRFTKFKTISGPNDVIVGSVGLNVSPNGKLLLWGVRVIPLDGGRSFDLVDMPNAARGSRSPDGRKVVFYAGAMWLIEVDPETGRPAGSAKKLLEGEYWAQFPVRWSPDSKRIVFLRRDSQVLDKVWTLSIETGELSQVADPFSFGIVSPNGKTVACSDGQGVMYQNSLRVKPVAGGEARTITDGVYPVVWSADSQWLVCKSLVGGGWEDEIRFVRVADGREVKVRPPGYLIRQSPQGGKLLFYHGSYDVQNVLKVISVAGGPAAEFGWPSIKFSDYNPGLQSWTPDAQRILVGGERTGGEWGLWALPLTGRDPLPLHIDTPLCRQAILRLLSPDGSKLLLVVREKDQPFDLWVVPISLAQMESTGPAVKVFSGMVLVGTELSTMPDAWSPDSKKIAFSHKGDIWVAPADGETPIQLTKTSEWDVWPDWSPDGTMIAFRTQSESNAPIRILVRVVPASGGEARVIADLPFATGSSRINTWSPDSKELTIASEGVISSFPISGGDARTMVRPKDMGIDDVSWPRWSPDGRLLAFQGGTPYGSQKLYTYRPDSAKPELLSGSDSGGEILLFPWSWSPDNKWISYFSMETVKTRPEGVLWEMDVEEALANLAK